ncbi:hypothetical protein [Trueperella sp. LYQ143]|uniref:hypothetical protein n=1 Tax=Trueperella sp. LYQ143 TaxID=3391059 RepID=UPI0039836AB4
MKNCLRPIGISIATTVFLTMMCVFAIASISFELSYRATIASSRAPQYTENLEHAGLAYRIDNTFLDGNLLTILYYEPLSDHTPPPPGLATWLEPGHSAITQSASDIRSDIEKQFGPIEATINNSVTLDKELLVYVRPLHHQEFVDLAISQDKVFLASGFSTDDGRFPNVQGAAFGFPSYERWAQYLFPIALVTLVCPLIVLIRATRRDFQNHVHHDLVILQCIGAPRRKLYGYCVSKLAVPTAIGSFLALIMQLLFASGFLLLPISKRHLHSAAFLPHLPTLVFIELAVMAFACLYITKPALSITLQSHSHNRKAPTWRGIAVFALGIVIAGIYSLTALTLPASLLLILLVLSIFCVSIGLSATLSALVQLTSLRAAKHSKDHLTALFARWAYRNADTASRPAGLAGIFIIIGVLLVGIFNILADSTSSPAPHEPSLQVTKTKVVCPETNTDCALNVAQKINEALPQAMIVFTSDGGGIQVLTTPDGAQHNLSSTLGSHPATKPDPDFNLDLARFYVQSYIAPRHGTGKPDLHHTQRAYIYTLTSASISPLDKIEDIDFSDSVLPPITEFDGENSRSTAAIYQQQASWLSMFAVCAFIIGISVTWIQFSKENSRQARELAPIISLTGKQKPVVRVLLRRNITIGITTGIAAIITGVYLSYQMLRPANGIIPWEFIAVITAIYTVILFAHAWASYRQITVAAKSWHPGKES